MKSIICVTETSRAYFIIEHQEGENPVELFRNWNDGDPAKDDFVQDELDEGYCGREITAEPDMNPENTVYPLLEYSELKGE